MQQFKNVIACQFYILYFTLHFFLHEDQAIYFQRVVNCQTNENRFPFGEKKCVDLGSCFKRERSVAQFIS